MSDLKGPIICGVASALVIGCTTFGEPVVSSDLLTPSETQVALTHGVCAESASDDVLSPDVYVSFDFGDIFSSGLLEISDSLLDVDAVFLLQPDRPLRVAQIESDLTDFSEEVENLGEPAPETPF